MQACNKRAGACINCPAKRTFIKAKKCYACPSNCLACRRGTGACTTCRPGFLRRNGKVGGCSWMAAGKGDRSWPLGVPRVLPLPRLPSGHH